MDKRFREIISSLDPSLERLKKCKRYKPLELPTDTPKAGIYVFSENGKNLYVGRSNRIRSRMSNHCRVSATHRTAAFAFLLAREETGKVRAAYKPKGSRADLMRNKQFKSAFENAKARIRKMNVRYVEETDPTRQCLLEVYAAIALRTQYNDFDNY